MVETNSEFQNSTKDLLPIYVNPDQISDIKNVRFRHIKPNIPIEIPSEPQHFILTTGDFQLNDREDDLRLMARYKHNIIQIILLILTTLFYLLHTLRTYIPEHRQTNSSFWTNMKISPIVRVYTSDLRPTLLIENFLLHLTEHCQAFWLLYVLTYIPRRTNSGYLYRHPDIFNTFLCILLFSSLSLQTITQSALPPEISCLCLFVSFILLIAVCRLVARKLLKYQDKFKSIDLIIIRYFVLNSLFLYTTLTAYSTLCVFIECFGFHLDPNVTSLTPTSIYTTIGLSIVLLLLLIYFLLDQFVYENEFRSIWTPYIFIAISFVCPPIRRFVLIETDLVTNGLNFYLLWIIFSSTILMMCIRAFRQISVKCRERKRKGGIIEQVNTEKDLNKLNFSS